MNSSRPRPLSRLLFVLAAVAVSVLGLVGPATAAAPYCGLTWGDRPEEATGGYGPTVTGVRAAEHACFDRVVVDLAGSPGAGWSVRYVSAVTEDPTGDAVPLRGGAALQVVVVAPSYDEDGDVTYRPADERELVVTAGFATVRQVAWAGSFEGYTTLGVGTRARLPFRVFALDGPGSGGRIVIDVAHRW